MAESQSLRRAKLRGHETWRFRELTLADAAAVVGWRYDGPYAFYDTAADPGFAAEFADVSLWRLRGLEAERDVLLAVTDVRDGLAGFFSFRGSPHLCVIGLGLAPELTGRSLGAGFVRASLDFARDQWSVSRFHLDVGVQSPRPHGVRAARVRPGAPVLARRPGAGRQGSGVDLDGGGGG